MPFSASHSPHLNLNIKPECKSHFPIVLHLLLRSLEKEPHIPRGLRAVFSICVKHKGGATQQA